MSTVAGTGSLQEAIDRAGSPVRLLRDAPALPYTFPVKPEFSNWRSEQRAWLETCVLFDQSHHMCDLFLEGPGAFPLLQRLGVNNFSRFRPDMAKQFVATNPDGYMIGDGILFYLGPDSFDFVGAHPAIVDWVQFNLEQGSYEVSVERDENSLDRVGPPKLYRYELQGPNAAAIMEAVIGGPLPDIKFFHMGSFRIAGHDVRCLRHGMAGQAGYELFGPFEEGESVLEALVARGGAFGLVRAGARAYSSANLESGWIPSPMPAIFSGEAMRPFREWRRASRAGSLGGSLLSEDISDYYVTPYDLGYGHVVSFDHDFIGHEALARIAKNPRRTKVTLVWNRDDVSAAMATWLEEGTPAKYFELPKSRYALFQSDTVLKDGEWVGISMDCGFSPNERVMISLATVDRDHAEPGTEVSVLWGEEPNSSKPTVEKHRQVEIRATVAPAPYSKFARESYRTKPVATAQ